MNEDNPYDLFAEAGLSVRQQLFVDATQQFLKIAQQYPEHELADDALYNAGLCYFQLDAFTNAIAIFGELIRNYPEATIYPDSQQREFGKTAAKALYALINCYLGLNQIDLAQDVLKRLDQYQDAYVLSGMNEPITFKRLAEMAIYTFKQTSG